MTFAAATTVPVEKSIAEIVSLVKRTGAERVAQVDEPDRFTIHFAMCERQVRFSVALPSLRDMPTRDGRGAALTAKQREDRMRQAHRQKARALLLVIKAKLESVASGVETFEQAFLPNVVMADGATVYDRIAAPIAAEYETGVSAQLLLGVPGA